MPRASIPVTQEVIRYALLQTNLEHSALIQRLCVSPIVMLSRDFQTSLMTEDGELVFLGPNLQYFSNSHALTVRWTLEHRADNPGIRPGDVFLSNDPFVGAPHQPDTACSRRCLSGGELFCWIANTLHYTDVGGSMPGSFCIDAQDTWAEPMSWPPVKLVEGGEIRARDPGALRSPEPPAAGAGDGPSRRPRGDRRRPSSDAAAARRATAPAVVKSVMRLTLDASEPAIRASA